MQDILTCAMGLDVHAMLSLLVLPEASWAPSRKLRFALSARLSRNAEITGLGVGGRVSPCCMESTGIYWQPIYEMLEPA